MSKPSTDKKDKQKMFRMTKETEDKFKKLFEELKGSSKLTLDEAFEIMIEKCMDKNLANKYPERGVEIQSFENCLDSLRIKFEGSLEMYESVKKDTEAKFEAVLNAKEKNIIDLVGENAELKEKLIKMESEKDAATKENFELKETIAKMEDAIAKKDDVINSNNANVEVARKLAEMMKNVNTRVAGEVNDTEKTYVKIPHMNDSTGTVLLAKPFSNTSTGTVLPAKPFSNTSTGTVLPAKPLSNTSTGTVLLTKPLSNTSTGTVLLTKPLSNTSTGTMLLTKPLSNTSTGTMLSAKPLSNTSTGTMLPAKPLSNTSTGTVLPAKPLSNDGTGISLL